MRKMSIEALAREQLDAARQANAGRSARTVFGGHEHTLRQTLVALTADSWLDEHETRGEATLQVLSGRVRLSSGEDSWEGRSGDLIIVPAARHNLYAMEDSAVLLTVALHR